MAVSKEYFGEGKHVECKEEIPKKHEKFLKDIIAFANTSGGKVVIGIEDETGEVKGLGEQNPFKLSDAISNMISDVCTPQIFTDITAKTLEGKTILEVEVFPGTNRPYYRFISLRPKNWRTLVFCSEKRANLFLPEPLRF